MGVKRWKGYRVGLVIAFYATVLLLFRYYDEEVFSEILYLVARAKELRQWTLTATDELSRAFHLPNNQRKNKTIILIWTPMFGSADHFETNDENCIVTYDRSAIDAAKAVVFHFADIDDNPRWLPNEQRAISQRWVWWCLEPPWNTKHVFRKHLTGLNGVFNWTMTYRHDSDIYYPYDSGKEKDGRENRTVAEMIKQKTGSALGMWVVSNCKASARSQMIEELQKYIKIDVWGKCTSKPLCRAQCALDVIKRYKFFFSFENSRCKDYITEKFTTNGLLGGAVPVVMGAPRSNYEKIAPPNSFIHVEDFDSAQQLAEYLLELDKDDVKYGEYLRWKSLPDGPDKAHDKATIYTKSGWELLCEKLKDSEPSSKTTVPNLNTWWYGDNSSTSACNPEDGPSGYSFHPHVTVGYTIGVLVCCLLTIKICGPRYRGG